MLARLSTVWGRSASAVPSRQLGQWRQLSFGAAPQRVSVVGAGQIGAACARGLLRAGHAVRVHDKSEANRADLEALGAEWVPEPSAVLNGDEHDVLVTALPAPPHVRSVMEEEDGGLLGKLRPGSLWIDHTTTDPAEAQRLHEAAGALGVKSLEAPLTGGYVLLKAGMMTVLVGGPSAVLEDSRGLMESYAATILHMGDYSKATVVKLITNQLAATHLVAAGEATMMAAKSGIDLQAFFEGVRASAGNSYVFETETPLFFNGTFEPGFAIALHNKDLDLARKIHSAKPGCADYDDAYKLNALAENIYKDTMARYGPDVGSSFPAKMLEDDLQHSMALPGYDDWSYNIEKVAGGSIGVVHSNETCEVKK